MLVGRIRNAINDNEPHSGVFMRISGADVDEIGNEKDVHT